MKRNLMIRTIFKSWPQIRAKNFQILQNCLQFVTLIGLQPLHCEPLENATISKMKSDIFKALQKRLETIAL
jgi:hypothetical protein